MEIINELPYLRYQFQEIPEISIVDDFALHKETVQVVRILQVTKSHES